MSNLQEEVDFQILESLSPEELDNMEKEYLIQTKAFYHDAQGYEIQNWYEPLKQYTMSSQGFPLTVRQAYALTMHYENELKPEDQNTLQELESKVNYYISEFKKQNPGTGDAIFMKLSTRSPKDYCWDFRSEQEEKGEKLAEFLKKRESLQKAREEDRLTAQLTNDIYEFFLTQGKEKLKIRNGKDFIKVFGSSDRIVIDLRDMATIKGKVFQDIKDGKTEKANENLIDVWMRQWVDCEWKEEFRCFYDDYKLTAITQYDQNCYFPELKANQKQITQIFSAFLEELSPKLKAIQLKSGVMDLTLPYDSVTKCFIPKPTLIEINVFNHNSRGSLFNWEKDKQELINSQKVTTRFHTQPQKISKTIIQRMMGMIEKGSEGVTISGLKELNSVDLWQLDGMSAMEKGSYYHEQCALYLSDRTNKLPQRMKEYVDRYLSKAVRKIGQPIQIIIEEGADSNIPDLSIVGSRRYVIIDWKFSTFTGYRDQAVRYSKVFQSLFCRGDIWFISLKTGQTLNEYSCKELKEGKYSSEDEEKSIPKVNENLDREKMTFGKYLNYTFKGVWNKDKKYLTEFVLSDTFKQCPFKEKVKRFVKGKQLQQGSREKNESKNSSEEKVKIEAEKSESEMVPIEEVESRDKEFGNITMPILQPEYSPQRKESPLKQMVIKQEAEELASKKEEELKVEEIQSRHTIFGKVNVPIKPENENLVEKKIESPPKQPNLIQQEMEKLGGEKLTFGKFRNFTFDEAWSKNKTYFTQFIIGTFQPNEFRKRVQRYCELKTGIARGGSRIGSEGSKLPQTENGDRPSIIGLGSQKMTFGKYNTYTFDGVWKRDPSYFINFVLSDGFKPGFFKDTVRKFVQSKQSVQVQDPPKEKLITEF